MSSAERKPNEIKNGELTVLLLRHGEREDEVIDDDGLKRLSPRERLDPSLTAQGFEHSRSAWVSLLTALVEKDQRVAVFTSPLRRTLGTALMIAPAWAQVGATNLEWGLLTPDLCQDHEATNSKELTDQRTTIPIVVLNGLCHCAAAITKLGGAHQVIASGWIHGAVMSSNDGSESSPVMKEITQMQGQIANVNRLTTVPLQVSMPWLQLYKYHDQSLVPFTPSFSLQAGVLNESGMRRRPFQTTQLGISKEQRSAGPDEFQDALEGAVRMAHAAKCQTIVIVTHREGIRDLAEIWPLPTPYCCIATFTARPSANSPCTWKFHGISSFERFKAACILR